MYCFSSNPNRIISADDRKLIHYFENCVTGKNKSFFFPNKKRNYFNRTINFEKLMRLEYQDFTFPSEFMGLGNEH
jgi:hypothetical protein